MAAAVPPQACRVCPPPCSRRTGGSAASPYASPTIRSGPTSKTTRRGSVTGSSRFGVGQRTRQDVDDPPMEAIAQVLGGLGEQVARIRQHLELATARERLHRLARHHRQELVSIAVQ